MRLITRAAVKRLGILAIVLGLVILFSWSCMIRMPGKTYKGPLPPLTVEQSSLRDELRTHVEMLAGEIGERNATYRPRSLDQAADYVASVLTNAGYSFERQTFRAANEDCHNLIVERRGSERPEEIVVVGAHYDSVIGAPGADDNASGAAALLALARRTELQTPKRTLRFVAFANEEPPHFQNSEMGSLVYAKLCRERSEDIITMIALESLGYYRTEKGSQKYPFPVGMFYPSQGDFVGFVGRTSERTLVRRCIRKFREVAKFPSEGAALPSALPGVGWSDHWAFWQVDYPAFMITDTAVFRNPYYHTEGDTPDKLDYDRFARVVDGIGPVIEDLVNH